MRLVKLFLRISQKLYTLFPFCLNQMNRFLLAVSLLLTFSFSACHRGPYKVSSHFDPQQVPVAPNYAVPANWAALPSMHDMADSVPYKSVGLRDQQAEATTDVFFVYPTTYTYEPKPGANQWNADVADADLNRRTDESAILNQATVFNGSCRVFAPRYRQAHYSAFTTQTPADKRQSLDLAYADVKAAFLHYLQHDNLGADGNPRPIIIASHSQGTIHATRLLTELFDGKPLREQLVAAYLVGIATPTDKFKTIPPGESATQTGCFVSWNTFAKDYIPDYYANGLNKALCTNPLLWNSSDQYAPKELNHGGVGLKFTFKDQLVDAQSHQGLLWVGTPNIAGASLVPTKIWHKADINFFWMNMRENVADRIRAFQAKTTAGR